MDIRNLLNDRAVDADPAIESATRQPSAPTPYAIRHDDWSLRRGEQTFRDSPAMQQVLASREDGECLTTDFRAAAFEHDPQVNDQCTSPLLAQYMQELFETDEFRKLRGLTVGDENASEIAATQFAKGYIATCGKVDETTAQTERGQLQVSLQAIRAAQQATKEVDQYDQCSDMIRGFGGEPGQPANVSQETLGQLFAKVRNSAMLRQVMALAGRYRRVAASAQRRKVPVGVDETVGVTQDGIVSRLMPAELCQLADDRLADAAMLRIVERTAQCREYNGIEQVGKGPIVVIVDETGSMVQDGNIYHAKAMALALYWVATQQRRWCCMVGYDGYTLNALIVPPGSDRMNQVLEWVDHFGRGATDLCIPIDKLPAQWDSYGCPVGKTDAVCITDAKCKIKPEQQASFTAWKQAKQVKLLTVVINDAEGEAAKVSDQVWVYNSLANGGEGVEEILSSI